MSEKPITELTGAELINLVGEVLQKFGALKFANDLHVETIDLSKDRSTSDKIEEFSKLKGALALTVFRLTGSMDLYINKKDDYHKLPFDAIEYPQTFLLGWFQAETFYVGNSPQQGKQAILVAWRRS